MTIDNIRKKNAGRNKEHMGRYAIHWYLVVFGWEEESEGEDKVKIHAKAFFFMIDNTALKKIKKKLNKHTGREAVIGVW